MKFLRYILPALFVGCMVASCDTEVENIEIQKPWTYAPLYYQNLRDYKASDHSIAWGWFADYTQSYSPATRFTGLPDSLDICSLWGGIPSADSTLADAKYLPEVVEEMRFVQKEKGTKLVVPTIIRIRGEKMFYDEIWVGQKDPEEAMRQYGGYLLAQIFVNDLDGIDLDYEPEGDPLSGSNLDFFVEFLGQFVGPKASPENTYVAKLGRVRINENGQRETYYEDYTIVGDPTKLLCIDYYGTTPGPKTNEYTNWYVNQTYGGSPGGLPFGGCPTEKVVYTENVGDNWQSKECGRLLDYARYQPSKGRKGGFGAFFMHRDYVNTGYGFNNYANMRQGIQIQNPSIY